MTDSSPINPAAVKRRQYLLLAGIAAFIVGATLLSVSLTGSRETGERVLKPKSTQILAPGGQVDPKDAWRGQADAQLKGIEQKSHELSQRNTELEGQNKQMLERLKKLEQTGLTPLPPPPVAAPATRPNFGPDRPSNDLTVGGPQRLPPPPPPLSPRSGSMSPSGSTFGSPAVPPAPTMGNVSLASSGIVSVALADGSAVKAAKTPMDATKANPPARDARRYIPSGTFTRAVLLAGLDAPTGGQAQRNPQPVLLRLADLAVLPNRFRSNVKECFVVGAGYGDVSSERAYIRTEALSCVTRDGRAAGHPREGLRGRRGRQGRHARTPRLEAGQILANALLAGVASGIGHAFQMNRHDAPSPRSVPPAPWIPASSCRPDWAPASARRWTGSPSTTSASRRRSSRSSRWTPAARSTW
jgi:conjugal transfer pilus assembly protein TraB